MTPEEAERLENWRKETPEHEALFQKTCDGENFKNHTRRCATFDPEAGWAGVEKRIQTGNRRKRLMLRMRYIAMFALPVIITCLSLFYIKEQHSDTKRTVAEVNRIIPGEVKAVLTLGNGKNVYLDGNSSGSPIKLDGELLSVDSTTLSYLTVPKANGRGPSVYNKIETPKGGEYVLLLSDGTKIHLNAMTRLRYPVTFGPGPRKVELEGEAYFEVSTTGQPFIVCTPNVEVEVLGTAFDVSAYPHEECRTTLVDGSVKINTGTGENCVLKPSQQAVVASNGNKIQVCTVDTEFYTSWTKGKIRFKDCRLEDIMKNLARWYDMEVVYADSSLKDMRFGCHINRYKEIRLFVELLEETENIHAAIKGNTITFYY